MVFVLSGCFHYSEHWRFDSQGAGTVSIRCHPAGTWLQMESPTQWLAGVRLFMPPYKALSQSCARVGVRVTRCRVETDDGVPRVEVQLAFPSVSHVARCPLFADRNLQWRANRFTAALLYRVPALPGQFAGAPLFAGEEETLRTATFDLAMEFPGRVIEVSGARRRGKLVSLALPFDAFVASNGVAVVATTSIALPWWYWTAGAIVVVVAVGLSLLWFMNRARRHANTTRYSFDR
jgi:hypothetical protein